MRSVKQTDILTGSIPKQLLLFFLPIWFGTLFQQLYNTADTLIVGNFVGTNALAAVGATGAFVNLLVGLFVGLCSGAGVVIAQSWGAHDPECCGPAGTHGAGAQRGRGCTADGAGPADRRADDAPDGYA